MSSFARTSRYLEVDVLIRPIHRADSTPGSTPERVDVVLGRRYTSWAPPLGSKQHVVVSGETFHLLADHFYGDAALWYRIADVNPEVFNPDDLTEDAVIWIPPASFVLASASRL